MSQQKLSTIQRLAIWHAHNQKCAYTREPLTYSDLEIDHIIPERLKDDKSLLAKTLERYNLPADFSIFSYKNMLPVHSRVNSQKSGTIFTDENARYYLEIANQKYVKVKEIEKELLKNIKSSDVLSALSAAIEAGWISNLEAISYLQSLISKNNGIELLHELDFIEQTFQGKIEPEAAVGLFDLKVKHGNSREIGLELTGPDSKIRVFSCREFSDAKKRGYYAYTTYDMKMEAFFNRTCDMINAIMHVRKARESHVGNPRIGINDIAYLPVSIIDTISPEQQELIEKDHCCLIVLPTAKAVEIRTVGIFLAA